MKDVQTFRTAKSGTVTLRTRTQILRGTIRRWSCTCGESGGDTLPDGTRLSVITVTQTAAAHAAECTD